MVRFRLIERECDEKKRTRNDGTDELASIRSPANLEQFESGRGE